MTVGAFPRLMAARRAARRVSFARQRWRPLRVGVGLNAESIRAVCVAADSSVRWAVEAQLDDGESLADALAELLAGAPLRRGGWPRPEVRVAVGHARAQTKRLCGLPPVSDPSLLAPLVAASAGRFFLRNGVPLVVTGVGVANCGEAWAGAIEAPVVEGVVRACRAARVRLSAIAPTAALVGLALQGDRHELVDDNVRTEVITENGRLAGVRRAVLASPLAPFTFAAVPVAGLATLGASAPRFADAYGAAMLVTESEPLAWRPRRGSSDSLDATIPAWRLWTAAGALAVSLLAAALAPGLAAHLAARAARAELDAIDPRARQAAAAEHELARLDAALGEVSAFDAGRRSPTALLRDLTAALPNGSALLTFRVDSAGGTAVALGPRAGAIVSAIERTSGVSAPEIVGPVTRETPPSMSMSGAAMTQSAPRELERVTVRFRLGGGSANGSPRGAAKPAPATQVAP